MPSENHSWLETMPNPMHLERLKLEPTHLEFANDSRDSAIKQGEEKMKTGIRARHNVRYAGDNTSLLWSAEIAKHLKNHGQEVRTPLTEEEIKHLRFESSMALSVRQEEVYDEDEGKKLGEMTEWVEDPRRGFTYLKLLSDLGVPQEKWPKISDRAWELIGEYVGNEEILKYGNNDSVFRSLAVIKKLFPDQFEKLRTEHGALWEEQVLDHLPTRENSHRGYQFYNERGNLEFLIDLLDVFNTSTTVRDRIREAIEITEGNGWVKNTNYSVQKELDRIKTRDHLEYDLAQYPNIILDPLRMAAAREGLAKRLLDPFPQF